MVEQEAVLVAQVALATLSLVGQTVELQVAVAVQDMLQRELMVLQTLVEQVDLVAVAVAAVVKLRHTQVAPAALAQFLFITKG